jgi:pimeloyl-ACP methyl ester carboxylesterase
MQNLKTITMKKFAFMMMLSLLGISSFAQSGYSFKVEISGKGAKPVILIPGFSCSGNVWKQTLDSLNPNFKCYTLTMAGFAGTAPEANPNFESWISSIAKYIRDHKIEKPAIIGHSIGGVMALWLAADHPDLVSRVIVVDALPCLSAMFNPAFKAKDTIDCTPMAGRFKAMADKDLYAMQRQNIPTLIADTTHWEEVIQWAMKSDRNTLGSIYCQFANLDLRHKIEKIKCPATILLESYFNNFKPAITMQYVGLKDVKMIYADMGLHFIMYDDKPWYFKELKAATR